jgi:hypothetical protein
MQIEHDSEASSNLDIEAVATAEGASEGQDQAAASGPGDADTGSSPTDAKEAPKSLLDVLQDVVKPAETPEATSAADPEKPETGEIAEGEPEKDLTDEELAKLPFGKHPRFKRMLADNKSLKGRVAEFETTVQELEGPAKQYRSIDTFLRQHEIEPPEFVRLMKVGALIKTAPEEARKEVLQVLFELDEMTGHALPADIRKDVEEGRMTEDRGRELSQTRAREARATERATVERARAENVTQETQTADLGRMIGASVADWEARVKVKDPDFSKKESFVVDRVQALNAQLGHPKTAEEAVQRAQEALDYVTTQMRGVVPPKPEVRRSPESGSSTVVAPVARTMREAIALAVK